jgi:pyrroline-5-carboxylate reductase
MSEEAVGLLGKRIAVIGAGAMGGALCRGLVESGAALPEDVTASDPHADHLQDLASRLHIRTTPSNAQAADGADILILAVKPFTMQAVLEEIAECVAPDTLVISIAAGIRTEMLEAALPARVPVIRAMPNTAAQVREGACAFCRGRSADDIHAKQAAAVFHSFGIAVQVEERMMDAVTAVSGSGPAYVYLMIEAMVDGGVKAGLPRDLAHQLACQTVLGAARMVMETGMHPAQLKDMVATPSGTTITALAALEQSGFRAALIDAVERAAIRSRELGG